MEFWVTLIKANEIQTKEAQHSLNVNCTYITKNYYIFEGDTFCLEEDNVKFEEIVQGVMGSLGGLSEKNLIKMVDEYLGIYIK